MEHSVNLLELIGGGKVPAVLIGTWMVMATLIVLGVLARISLGAARDPMLPDEEMTLRSLCELAVEWFDGFVHEVVDVEGYRKLVPFFGSLFFFILFGNFFGLIPGMAPPSGDSDLTFGLGVLCLGFYVVQGFRANGARYLRSFLGPVPVLAPLMVPIELVDNLFRPFSLGVRLYANMFADHTVLGIFTGLTKLVIPLAFYALGSIVCIIQALIFVVLAMSYVRLAASHEH